MNIPLRLTASILSLPALVVIACIIDAGLSVVSKDFWDFSYRWWDSASRLVMALLLVSVCRLLWSNPVYRRLFAAIYLFVGLGLSIARILIAEFLVFVPVPSTLLAILANGSVSQFTFALIATIGAAAFFPPSDLPPPPLPQAEETER